MIYNCASGVRGELKNLFLESMRENLSCFAKSPMMSCYSEFSSRVDIVFRFSAIRLSSSVK